MGRKLRISWKKSKTKRKMVLTTGKSTSHHLQAPTYKSAAEDYTTTTTHSPDPTKGTGRSPHRSAPSRTLATAQFSSPSLLGRSA